MNENLEEKQNVEIEEDKDVKDAFDAYVKAEKERVKKSNQDKFERMKRYAEKEEEIKLKRIEEEAEERTRRMKEGVKTETEMKIIKFNEDLLIKQENEFQIIDEYANKELENIYIKRNKEALKEKLRNNIESISN